MDIPPRGGDSNGLTGLDGEDTRVLSATEERALLRALADARRTLAEALAGLRGVKAPGGADDPASLAQEIASFYAGDGAAEARLGAVYRRYGALRGKLAMANMRLVAHVAKRFRDRGIAYPDLIQEGVCGLLEAIDRFDLGHETKLATYATWWIRQAMQRAVAAGAYPVRLSPRHLRQLAQSQDELDGLSPGEPGRPGRSPGTSSELIHRIHAATRPSVSLDATFDPGSGLSLIQTLSETEADPADGVDTGEAVAGLMHVLRPREQEVVSLRFGLGGKPKLSLSKVGKVMAVSKERVRQIQDRALVKLRAEAESRKLGGMAGGE